MNIITNQPINSINNMNKVSAPAFTAKPKLPSAKEIQHHLNVVQKLYSLFFVPRKESVMAIKDGFALTKRVDKQNHLVFAKKYKLYSKEPEMTVKDNLVTRIKTKVTHKGDVNDVEICDVHTPDYKISAKYENVKDYKIEREDRGTHWFSDDYKGGVNLKYGEKEIKLSNEERERIHSELDKSVEQRLDKPMSELTKMGYEKFQEYMNSYYQDPAVIGRAILSSPSALEHQVSTVPSSMPYGIEEIIKHVK